MMPLSPLAKSTVATAGAGLTALAGAIGGLSVEGFLALIVAANGIELGLIVHNTASVNKLSGRYDADHAPEPFEPQRLGTLDDSPDESCRNVLGDDIEDFEYCGNPDTHTVVMRDANGDLTEVPYCDECDPEAN